MVEVRWVGLCPTQFKEKDQDQYSNTPGKYKRFAMRSLVYANLFNDAIVKFGLAPKWDQSYADNGMSKYRNDDV